MRRRAGNTRNWLRFSTSNYEVLAESPVPLTLPFRVVEPRLPRSRTSSCKKKNNDTCVHQLAKRVDRISYGLWWHLLHFHVFRGAYLRKRNIHGTCKKNSKIKLIQLLATLRIVDYVHMYTHLLAKPALNYIDTHGRRYRLRLAWNYRYYMNAFLKGSKVIRRFGLEHAGSPLLLLIHSVLGWYYE